MTPPTQLPTAPPRALSVSEQGLYSHLLEHISTESSLLESYEQLSEAPDTPAAVRYLLRLVIEDEERHHRLLHDIVVALGNGIAWPSDPQAAPDLPFKGSGRGVAEVTERFLAAERSGRRKLRALRRQLRPLRDTTVWTLLVEVIEQDTIKHIRLLKFIARHC